MPQSSEPCSILSSSSSARNKTSFPFCRAAFAAALLSLACVPSSFAGQFNAAVYDDVKPSVVRITCTGKADPASLWSSPDSAVTALHVVSGCSNITVYFEALKISRPPPLPESSAEPTSPSSRSPIPPTAASWLSKPPRHPSRSPSPPLATPFRSPALAPTDLHLRWGGKTLRDIVPETVANNPLRRLPEPRPRDRQY